jgi:putative phage-type endonuclease
MALTQTQLVKRKKGISASDVASIVGENKWRGPIDVWMDKLAAEPPLPQQETESQALGNYFEKSVAEYYRTELVPDGMERRIYRPRKTLQHPEVPWVFATPDRFVFEKLEGSDFERAMSVPATRGAASHLLEVKLVGHRMAYQWFHQADDTTEIDCVPSYVQIQCQWQMFVTGYRRVDVCALIGGTKLSTFTINYDEQFIDHLYKVCHYFWHEYVLKETEPPPDGSKSFGKYLKNRWAYAISNELAEAPEQARESAEKYDNLAKEIKKLRGQQEVEKQLLKSLIGPNEGIIGDWGKATWANTKGRVNYDALIKDLQINEETLEKYRTPSRTFRLTMAKKGK